MICKYEIIAPVTDNKLPHFDKWGNFVIPAIGKNYRYYVECARYNPATFSREYFLLLSDNKFDKNCRKCRVDNYGRLKLILHGELKRFVDDEVRTRGNVEYQYADTEEDYDVYMIY